MNGNNSGGIRNCLIIGNSAGSFAGGGAWLENKNMVENCTIVSNYAGGSSYGGGIFVKTQAGGTNYLANCIVYHNIGGGNYSNYCDVYGDAFASYSNCCIAPAISVKSQGYSINNIAVDPQCVSKDTGNFRLSRNSLCINAGVNRAWMTGAVDRDGHRRVDKFSGIVDIGCYEYLPSGVIFTMK